MRRKLYGLVSTLLLTSCSTAVDVVTLPVRVVGKGIDAVYVSQADRDRARGRRERKAEAQAAKAQRKAAMDAEKQAARDR